MSRIWRRGAFRGIRRCCSCSITSWGTSLSRRASGNSSTSSIFSPWRIWSGMGGLPGPASNDRRTGRGPSGAIGLADAEMAETGDMTAETMAVTADDRGAPTGKDWDELARRSNMAPARAAEAAEARQTEGTKAGKGALDSPPEPESAPWWGNCWAASGDQPAGRLDGPMGWQAGVWAVWRACCTACCTMGVRTACRLTCVMVGRAAWAKEADDGGVDWVWWLDAAVAVTVDTRAATDTVLVFEDPSIVGTKADGAAELAMAKDNADKNSARWKTTTRAAEREQDGGRRGGRPEHHSLQAINFCQHFDVIKLSASLLPALHQSVPDQESVPQIYSAKAQRFSPPGSALVPPRRGIRATDILRESSALRATHRPVFRVFPL